MVGTEKQFATTTTYIKGDANYDFLKCFRRIVLLKKHRGCGSIKIVPNAVPPWILTECTPAFLEEFWTCAAIIADYFYTFFPHDSIHMQQMWLDLLDKHFFPAARLPHNCSVRVAELRCTHAQAFTEQLHEYSDFMNLLLRSVGIPAEPLVTLEGVMEPTVTGADYGRFRSDITAWEQFLMKDSPGFGVDDKDKVYPKGKIKIDDQGKTQTVVHVPRGALAIVSTYIERLREIMELIYEDDPKRRHVLRDFDNTAFDMSQQSIYTSLDGRKLVVEPMYPVPNSANAPKQPRGPADPGELLRNPGLQQLDESIGKYMIEKRPFIHPDGDDQFHMLTVTRSERDTTTLGPDPDIDPEVFDKMFDDWDLPPELGGEPYDLCS
ncbi:hypothetical protein EJ04DRAFT_563642 [Polyplosphaeria fusca]|uniref:Uncharacterized protein n=1 Tax=Polyplosphaeria fusca TaxID=682080 RepID=A0A9P4V3A9_9PLEO|nr:hypothetical protein EJ04DRAFT_563642 [Polyplosphaeria fusca]